MITYYATRQIIFCLIVFLIVDRSCLPTLTQEFPPQQQSTPAVTDGDGKSADSRLAKQLEAAGENRGELEKAIRLAPSEQRDAVKFLIAEMPASDLQKLTADFLLTNVRLAYEARKRVPWQIPDEIFFNEVLPYANIDEPRDPWRQSFFELCWPLVQDCKTAADAAQRLNEAVFEKIGVKYSTGRRRANQSPRESMEQGMASCTGLSIILVDACRSVGVPARLVGIPSWKNKRGNHTWVEVWDQQWHFTGAAEPAAEGLNHAWFENDAALADPDSREHSIYAVSFRQRETVFPLVWAPGKTVFAENVTARYARATEADPADTVNVMFRVWNPERSARIVADVKVIEVDDQKQILSGQSRGNTTDMNDMLTLVLKSDSEYQVQITADNLSAEYELKTGSQPNELLEIVLAPSNNTASALNDAEKKQIVAIAKQYFSGEPGEDLSRESVTSANDILTRHPQQVRELVWEIYLQSPLGRIRKSDFEANQVSFEQHVSPYTIKEVGQRPASGWPLVIAMHGGGGAPQKVNDSQWKHMQVYYKDQPEVTGYKYLALRAPNNTWNGFYDDYVYPLIENLIQQCIVFADVDPNRVFLIGYSHGGYGAFAIGPKIPYRFAAVHASAAAPTDGLTSAKTLRNTRFTFMVGEKDNAYGRRERCEKFAQKLQELKGERDDIFPVEFMFKKGYGHGGLPDRDMISAMYDFERQVIPRELDWEMTDSVVDHFFWLSVKQPARGQRIEARIDENNNLQINAEKVSEFTVRLDRRLIDSDKPIMIQTGERRQQVEYRPDIETLCRSVAELGDINLATDFEVQIQP